MHHMTVERAIDLQEQSCPTLEAEGKLEEASCACREALRLIRQRWSICSSSHILEIAATPLTLFQGSLRKTAYLTKSGFGPSVSDDAVRRQGASSQQANDRRRNLNAEREHCWMHDRLP